MATTRAEHLAWCKQRALEHVDRGELADAVTSMGQDMGEHPETDSPSLSFLIMIGLNYVMNDDAYGVRHWIEGFN